MGKISVFQTKFYAHRVPQATVLPRKLWFSVMPAWCVSAHAPCSWRGETVRI